MLIYHKHLIRGSKTEIQYKIIMTYIPARAGWTGLDPFRFFTGTVGTLKIKHVSLNYQVTNKIKPHRSPQPRYILPGSDESPVNSIC